MKRIDLHIHSTCSDGELTPIQIIDEAILNNVNTLSIADHDTIIAYTPDLFDYAKQKGVKIIPSVEISTEHDGVTVHILGYNFDINNKKLNNALNKLRNARHTYLINVCKKLNMLGYEVNIQTLKNIPSVTKANIALDIISNFNNKQVLINSFGHIPTKGEFIEAIMNRDCPAYVDKFRISPTEAANLIHNAKGVVVLAHPVVYKHEKNKELPWVLNLAKIAKVDAIESNYIYISSQKEIINESPFWNEIAKTHGYFSTIGSDFHSFDTSVLIGLKNTTIKLSSNEINLMLKNLQKNI